MWRFQQQALSEKKNFLLRLSTVSLLLHTIFLGLIFLTQHSVKVEQLQLKAHAAHVRFVATFDTNKIKKSQHRKDSAKVSAQGKSSLQFKQADAIKAQNTNSNKQKAVKSHTQIVSKKKAISSLSKKNGTKVNSVGTKKNMLPKKEPVKQTNTQQKKKMVPHEQSSSFVSSFNETFLTSKIVNDMLHTPVDKNLTVNNGSLVKTDDNKDIKNSSLTHDQERTQMNSNEEIIYVSPCEYNALTTQQELQEALQAVWSPPVGVSKQISAQVTITIDNTGDVVSAVFKKSSGVLIFDNSIEYALQKIIVPESVWSKTLTVTFSP